MSGLLLLALATFGPARPLPAEMQEGELLRLFAGCAGRLSAEMEHRWLFGDAEADRMEEMRDAMLSLVAALLPPGGDAQAMRLRLEAKAAQGALLSRATFAQDRAAGARAEGLTRACVALLGQS